MEEKYEKMVNKDYMKSLEEAFQKAVDKDLIEKMAKGREKVEKEREEERKQKEIEEEKRKAEEEKEILEEGMKILEEREKVEALRKKSDKVEITYSAKFDAFLIKNIDLNDKCYKIDRKALEPITSSELAKKMNEPEEKFKNMDRSTMLHLQLLCNYDEKYKTNKANQYLEEEQSERSREEKARYMKDIWSIGIHYDVTSLYEKDKFTEEERDEILGIVNTSKEKGMAIVKKGMKVYMKETVNKIKGLFSKIKTLKLPLSQAGEGQGEDKKKVQQTIRTHDEKIKTIGLIMGDRALDKREAGNLEYLKQDEIEKKNNSGLTKAEQQKRRAMNTLKADRTSEENTTRSLENIQQYELSQKPKAEQQKEKTKNLINSDRGALQQYVIGDGNGQLEENARKRMVAQEEQGAEEGREQEENQK